MNVALIGLSGAGKSAVAPLLAGRLGFECVDLDREIEGLGGAAVAAIFDERGEAAFREIESHALAVALAPGGPDIDASPGGDGPTGRVVACGGGVLGSARNRDLLKRRAWVVWLRVEPAVAALRLGKGAQTGRAGAEGGAGARSAARAEARPLLRGGPLEERLGSLLEARAQAYAEAADVAVDTRDRTIEEVADAIVPLWETHRARWGSSGS
ncbi:MAG: shikimate kinase [Candidatus Latescibacteria bacterium]|nr:shikimate kinase [Candidatus Latescibacterota bacterium]